MFYISGHEMFMLLFESYVMKNCGVYCIIAFTFKQHHSIEELDNLMLQQIASAPGK
jgi:hypothetical protein